MVAVKHLSVASPSPVTPFVVSLSNHERQPRSPFDKLRANGSKEVLS